MMMMMMMMMILTMMMRISMNDESSDDDDGNTRFLLVTSRGAINHVSQYLQYACFTVSPRIGECYFITLNNQGHFVI